MCECKDVGFGTYRNVVSLQPPWREEGDTISVDGCLALELLVLWSQGIKTYASCCGHNKKKGDIIADASNCKDLTDLGYQIKEMRPGDVIVASRTPGTQNRHPIWFVRLWFSRRVVDRLRNGWFLRFKKRFGLGASSTNCA